MDIRRSSEQGKVVDQQPQTGALKVWLQLLGLLAFVAVLGYGMLWVRSHVH